MLRTRIHDHVVFYAITAFGCWETVVIISDCEHSVEGMRRNELNGVMIWAYLNTRYIDMHGVQ